MLRSQRKIYTLALEINILTMAARNYYDEEFHRDCVLEMIERKSKLIKKISEKVSYELEFGSLSVCKD